jgi:hypothetical protein
MWWSGGGHEISGRYSYKNYFEWFESTIYNYVFN